MTDSAGQNTHETPATAADVQAAPIDLAAIERDLHAVEASLPRLDDGTYWIDADTGAEIPDEVLAADPTARRG